VILILLTRQRQLPVSPDTITETPSEEEGLGGGEEGSDACGIDDDDGPEGGVIAQILSYDSAEKDAKTHTNVPRNQNGGISRATQVALLYKYRWRVELFFKWIKQHLKIKSFGGTTETAVRIQIYSAITAYCMVAIVEHDLKLHRSTYEVLRILSASLLDKTPIKELFTKEPEYDADDGQLTLNFI